MHLYDSVPERLLIRYPNCPRCGAPMWLARIAPDRPDHDQRTFECPECDHAITEVVKYK